MMEDAERVILLLETAEHGNVSTLTPMRRLHPLVGMRMIVTSTSTYSSKKIAEAFSIEVLGTAMKPIPTGASHTGLSW
jgi:hypothetical protein